MIGVAELFRDLHETEIDRADWVVAMHLERDVARRREWKRQYEKRPHVIATRRRYETRPDVIAKRRDRIKANDFKRYWSDPDYRERKKQMARQWAANNKARRRERRRRNGTK